MLSSINNVFTRKLHRQNSCSTKSRNRDLVTGLLVPFHFIWRALFNLFFNPFKTGKQVIPLALFALMAMMPLTEINAANIKAGENTCATANSFVVDFESNNTGGGDWNSLSTWTVGGMPATVLPTASDNVTIVGTDVVNINHTISADFSTLTIETTAELGFFNTATLTGSGITNNGTMNLIQNIGGVQTHYIESDIANHGTINWNSGAIASAAGSTLTNEMTGVVNFNSSAIAYTGLNITNKSGGNINRLGTGNQGISTTFRNDAGGTVTVTTGGLIFTDSLSNAGAFAGNGSVELTGGGHLFDGGTFGDGTGTLGLHGTINITSPTGFVPNFLTVNQNHVSYLIGLSNPSMAIPSGTTFNVFNTSGNYDGFSGITNDGTMELIQDIGGTQTHILNSDITNNGTFNWNSGNITSAAGATLTNESGGVVNFNASAMGYSGLNITNKSGGNINRLGTGNQGISTTFRNDAGGTVTVTTGGLIFTDSLSNAGAFAGNGSVELTGGGHLFDGGTFGDGTGTLGLHGTINITSPTGFVPNFLTVNQNHVSYLIGLSNPSMTIPSGTTFNVFNTSGNYDGFSGITNDGTMELIQDIGGTQTHILNSDITNNGTFNWNSGNITSAAGATLTNESGGVVNFNSTAIGYSGLNITNKSGGNINRLGSGNQGISTTFRNDAGGTVTVTTGGLIFADSLSNAGAFAGNGSVELTGGGHLFDGGTFGDGTGTLGLHGTINITSPTGFVPNFLTVNQNHVSYLIGLGNPSMTIPSGTTFNVLNTSGNYDGFSGITNDGTMELIQDIGGTQTHILNSDITNNGTFNWNSGNINGRADSTYLTNTLTGTVNRNTTAAISNFCIYDGGTINDNGNPFPCVGPLVYDYVSNNTGGGDWNNVNTWLVDGVVPPVPPTSDDNVTIVGTDVVNIIHTISADFSTLTIETTAELGFFNTATLTGSGITNNGTMNLIQNIGGVQTHYIESDIANHGTINWNSGAIASAAGSTLTNEMTGVVNFNSSAIAYTGLNITNKSGGNINRLGTGNQGIPTTFRNDAGGTVTVTTGGLIFTDSLSNAGAFAGNGSVELTGGGHLFDGGTFGDGTGTLGLHGTINITSPTGFVPNFLTVNQNHVSYLIGLGNPSMTIPSGTTFNVFNTSGNYDGFSGITNDGTMELIQDIGGTQTHILNSDITNNSTFNWNSGNITSAAGATLTNESGGVVNFNASALGYTGLNITNKSGGNINRLGSGNQGISTTFRNDAGGTVTVTTGGLIFTDSLSNAGAFAGNGVVELTGGGHLFDGGTFGDGTGTLGLHGTINITSPTGFVPNFLTVNQNHVSYLIGLGNPSMTIPSMTTFNVFNTSGNYDGFSGITNDGTMELIQDIGGTQTHILNSDITNNGTFNWNSGNITSAAGATLTNESGGVVNFNASAMGYSGLNITNKSGGNINRLGSGNQGISTTFRNDAGGTVTVTTGGLIFTDSLSNAGAFAGNGSVELTGGGHLFDGGTFGDGTGTLGLHGTINITSPTGFVPNFLTVNQNHVSYLIGLGNPSLTIPSETTFNVFNTSGNYDGFSGITNDGTMELIQDIGGTQTHILNSDITNNGTFNWNSGNINGRADTTYLTNLGTFNRTSSNTSTNFCINGNGTVNNTGAALACLITEPEMDVQGGVGLISIANGDDTPDVADETDFQSFPVTTNHTHTFTIENTGSGDLTLGMVTVDNTTDFTITTQPATTVAPGTTTTFDVTFAASVAGLRTGIITIPNDDVNEAPYTFHVQGTGLATPDINVQGGTPLVSILNGDDTPSVVDGTDFEDVLVGNSDSHTFVVENTGNAVLNLTNITISNTTDFAVFQAPPTVEASSSVNFTITFMPQSMGAKTAIVTISSNDPDENPYTFHIAGNGTADPATALNFDGTNDFVDASATSTGLPQGAAPRTIEAWVKTSQSGLGNIVSYGQRTTAKRFSIAVRDNKFAFVGEQRDIKGNTTINDDQWHHVACTFDGTKIKLYVDGTFDIEATFNDLNTTDNNLRIGQIAMPSTGEFFNGDIDEVRIWDYELCEAEIQAGMNCELAGTETGLLNYYQFNQGYVGVNNSSETTLTDATGNADGTLTNFALTGTSSNWIDGTANGVSGSCSPATCPTSDIDVRGGNPLVSIVNGDDTPSTTDDTDFGSQNIGVNHAHIFQIHNVGTGGLVLGTITIDNTTDFTINQVSNFVGPNGSTNLTVTFNASSLGLKTGIITIPSNDPDEDPFTFHVSGNGNCDITIDNVATTDETCDGDDDGTITVTATCNSCTGAVEYSIDGSTWVQNGGSFTNLADGTYTVYVRDAVVPACTTSSAGHVVDAGTVASFTALADLCSNEGVQSGLGGGTPTGGIYSGTGVTDDGNGMTYSFDPSVGAGTYPLIYTSADGCIAADMVEVFATPVVDLNLGGCTWTLHMNDLNNNNWQGGFLEISIDGGPYVSYTHSFGSGTDQVPLSISNGGTLDQRFTGGSWTWEVSWWITDDEGNVVFGAPLQANYPATGPAPGDVSCQAPNICQEPQLATSCSAAFDQFCVDAGVQSGLGNATPTGGVYSGTGVTDDGNGMTFNFDPATAGVGSHTVTYTYTDGNGCMDTATDDLEVVAQPDIATIPTQSITCPVTTLDLLSLTITDNNAVPGTTTTFHSAAPASATDMTNQLGSTTISTNQTVYVMVAHPTAGCFDVESFMVEFIPCPPATALNFDGTNDMVVIGNVSSLDFERTDEYSMEAWFRTTGPSLGTIFSKIFDTNTHRGYDIVYDGSTGKIITHLVSDWTQSNAIRKFSSVLVNDGNWHHIAVTYDGSSSASGLKIYIDGVEDTGANADVDNLTNSTVSTTTEARIGQRSGAYFEGDIDEVRVWDYTLCEAEVTGRKDCELTGTESGLVVSYNFNQGYVGGNNSGETTLTDATGNHDGTLTNFALTGATSNWSDGSANGVSGSCTPATCPVSDIDVRGGNPLVSIVNGDDTPSTTDDTDFGNQNVGVNHTHIFKIYNVGTGGLTLGTITIDNTTDFTINQVSNNVGPNGFTDLTVTFNASTGGLRTGIITIPSNDPDEDPFTFHVSGNGLPADIDVRGGNPLVSIVNGDDTPSTTDDTDFGNQNVGVNHTHIFKIYNVGPVGLTLGTITIDNTTDFTINQVSNNVGPNGFTDLTVTFNASTSGQRDAIITIPSNDPDEDPFTYHITGNGNPTATPFITTWETTNAGEMITIPTSGTGYDYTVDWGDGMTSSNQTGDATHSYATAGVHTISISGDFPRIYINDAGDKLKIKSIEQWGSIEWATMKFAFKGAANLVHNATDAPDLSNVVSMEEIFYGATNFNGDLSNWDVSNIINMSGAFKFANAFNGNITNWDVSNVVNTSYMFNPSTSFNQDLNWDVSNVTNMSFMFGGSTSFNGDITNWNTSSVTNMNSMFKNAPSFNQPLNWDVSNVTVFKAMFFDATGFNQPLAWDVSSGVNMEDMFYRASSFDQDLGGWNISSVTNMNGTLFQAGLSLANYDNTLIGWAAQTVQSGVTLSSNTLEYCNGEAARNTLTSAPNNWTIVGDTKVCPPGPGDAFITTWQTTMADESITIPTTGGGYDYTIDWGDGSTPTTSTATNPSHTYATPGTYTVSITGQFPRIRTYFSAHRHKLMSVEQWGTQKWTSMNLAFAGCPNLVINASDTPDFSNLTDIWAMFHQSPSITGANGNWDWDVSNVTHFGFVFSGTNFNGDISNWDVSNAVRMRYMFQFNNAFNQDISGWDVSNVYDMYYMFRNATSFDQNLGNWDISNVTEMRYMLHTAGLSVENYDNTLIGWAAQTVKPGVRLFSHTLKYCNGEAARNTLTSAPNYWVITGDALECPQAEFITTWETTANGESITIPTATGFGAYNYSVDWGDGNTTSGHTGDATHTYATAGVHTVKISGNFPRIFFNDAGDKLKIKSIEQWGDIEWGTMKFAFKGAANLVHNATDAPDLSNVTSLEEMFYGATNFNGDLANWDVSNTISMKGMFKFANAFNGNITNWNVANVVNTSYMFNPSTSFNQDLNWDVSKVTNMSFMFGGSTSFNGDITNWNTSSVTNMNSMFKNTPSFNQPLNWDVSNVTVFKAMFFDATGFNQPLAWNVSSGVNMENMFYQATSFDQDLGAWNISTVNNMNGMLFQAGLSLTNYDNTLIGWAAQTVQSGVTLSSNTLEYCNGEAARNTLTSAPNNWTIVGDTKNCPPGPGDAFITTWQTTTANESITIPTTGGGYDYTIDWGDGSTPTTSTATNPSHTYATPGTYTVSITGQFPRIRTYTSAHRHKLMSVEQWGTQKWTSMHLAFARCPNLVINASDTPDFSNLTYIWAMFYQSPSITGANGNWDWDVSNVTHFGSVFSGTNFNGDISNWDVSNAVRMAYMFKFNNAFNQDISGWDVSNVYDMHSMFYQAKNFDQNLGSWDISNVTEMNYMLHTAGLSVENYDNTLIGWAAQTVKPGVRLFSHTLKYCNGEAARNTLTSAPNNWVITGDALECPPPAFTTTWETTADGESITIPTTGTGYNYTVNWGDGNTTSGETGDATHSYATAGVYTVSISGTFPRIYFANAGDKDKIKSIEQWGVNNWAQMGEAFYGCTNLVNNATDAPNLSNVTSMFSMFRDATSFDGDLSGWDVSNINTLSNTFKGATMFNGNITNWNVSNVTNMEQTFAQASSFNQDLSSWNVSSVERMDYMFRDATSFNSSLANWDVSNCTRFFNMFRAATSFNQDLSSWTFNTTNNVTMQGMFRAASSFDQNIGNWNITKVTNMVFMLSSSGLSETNYDNTLIGWAAQAVTSNVTLYSHNLTYCAGENARNTLINTHGWTIVGDSENCPPAPYVGTEIPFSTETQVENENTPITMNVYPNPASEFFTIELNRTIQEDSRVVLYDQLGKVVLENIIATDNSSLNINLSENRISTGIYTVTLFTDNEIVTKRLVIKTNR